MIFRQQTRSYAFLRQGGPPVAAEPQCYLLLRAPEEAAAAFLNAPTINEALHEIADPALANIVREAV